jgi:purine-binding chemotaxis protein CheW
MPDDAAENARDKAAQSGGFFVFGVGNQLHGLPLASVDKIVRAAEITSLPKAPETVSGLLNVRGKIIPVVNIHRLFNAPPREMELDDCFVIANTSGGRLAFLVDSIHGVVEFGPGDLDGSQGLFPELERFIEAVGQINGKTVLIHDSDKLLSPGDAGAIRRQTDC